MKRKTYLCKENDNEEGQIPAIGNMINDLSLMMLGIKI